MKQISAIVVGISLLLATSASAKQPKYSKFLVTFKADGVTTTLTLPMGKKWDNNDIKSDSKHTVKNETILTGNALLNFGPNGQNLSVTADKISYKNLSGQDVALFTLTGHIVFNLNRNSKDAMRFTTDSATLNINYSP